MSQNTQDNRLFFRFDVRVGYYMEPVNEDGLCMHIDRQSLISDHDYQMIVKESESLHELLNDEQHKASGSSVVFIELHQKLQFMVFLLEAIMHGEPIQDSDALNHWVNLNNTLSAPHAKEQSPTILLLQAFYQRVDDYINELLEIVQSSEQGKVFMYHKPAPKYFKMEDYVANLSKLAKQGNWLARVISLLVVKLNHYERLLKRLKKAYAEMANSDNWPLERISLGGGGFAIHSHEEMSAGQRVCVLFQLDDDYVFAKARCVYNQPSKDDSERCRVAFEFDELSAEGQAKIIRFMTHKELELARSENE